MSSKPKNRIFCLDAERSKMLFETESKADNFIKFNSEEIKAETGYSPKRSYYCMFCNGWHVTSKIKGFSISKKEMQFLNLQKRSLTEGEIINKIESKVASLNDEGKNKYFARIIKILKYKTEKENDERLKEFRKWLHCIYRLRKNHGYVKPINKLYGKMVENELEDWRQWAEQKINHNGI